MRKIQVIDSHTGGEPTRVVIDGGPDLGSEDMTKRRDVLRQQNDDFRRAVMNEPRGWDAMVGALLCEPANPEAAAGVIFFNNVGYLGMCVHGMIGVVATLAHHKRVQPGEHRFETPVGDVQATLHDDGQVSVRNVASYRLAQDVRVTVAGVGEVTGDVAWGGNWFFLVACDPSTNITLPNIDRLTDFTWAIRQALSAQGITGEGGAEIDHIELFGPPTSSRADSKNFVLCPGKAYDRSPCGTGTSAKVACLYADGKLKPGETWRQESIVGSIFEASVEVDSIDPSRVIPTIRGSAHITADTTLLFDPDDPFRAGISDGADA